MTITLTVENRTERGKQMKRLREAGKLPAVVYGGKEGSTAITIDGREFEKAFKQAGESSVLVLTGLDADKEVLIHEVSFDPLKGTIAHIDFYALKKGQDVTVHIPIVFVGEAPAVKLGGSLTKALHELEVTGQPSKLPHEIEVDVSGLATFEDHVRVKDLSLPKGVKVENDGEETVAVVTEAKEEEAEAVINVADVEVEQKGKEKPGE